MIYNLILPLVILFLSVIPSFRVLLVPGELNSGSKNRKTVIALRLWSEIIAAVMFVFFIYIMFMGTLLVPNRLVITQIAYYLMIIFGQQGLTMGVYHIITSLLIAIKQK